MPGAPAALAGDDSAPLLRSRRDHERNRPRRPGCISSRAPGVVCATMARRGPALGHHGNLPEKPRARGRAAGPGRPLHARDPRRAHRVRSRGLAARDAGCERLAVAGARASGASLDPAGDADRHGKGLLPGRSRPAGHRASGHTTRPRSSGAAAQRDRVRRGRAGAPPRAAAPCSSRHELRQPRRQRPAAGRSGPHAGGRTRSGTCALD